MLLPDLGDLIYHVFTNNEPEVRYCPIFLYVNSVIAL